MEASALLAFVAFLGFLVYGAYVSLRGLEDLADSSDWVSHTNEVIAQLERLGRGAADAIPVRPSARQDPIRSREGADTMRAAFERLRFLTRDNPDQQRDLDRLVTAFQTGEKSALERAAMIRVGIVRMQQREVELLTSRRATSSRRLKAARVSVLATTLIGILLLALVGGLVYRVIRDLGRRRFEREQAAILLEARVRERTDDLRLANEELEAFSYSVSHDLRSPLRSVNAYVSMIEEDLEDRLRPEEHTPFKKIRHSTQKMSELIEDLLKLGHAGRGSFTPTEIDVTALATDVAATVEERQPVPNATWHVQPNLRAVADEGLLRILLENLVRNAWKFSARVEAPRIEIGQTGNGAYFVKDNGVGFDAEKAGAMFRPFSRMESGASFEGTGVGLAICARIVSRHGGRIWAESQPGQGSTFFFTLDSASRSG